MGAEEFQLIDDEIIEYSIRKRDFLKINHQHGAQVNDANQSNKSYFGENLKYIYE